MDIVLHIGAHRTATTTFQSYLRRHLPELARMGIGVWGPLRTRKGLLSGIRPDAPNLAAAGAHLRAQLQRRRAAGLGTLLISDENILGSVQANLKDRQLYAGLDARLGAYAQAFDGQVTRIVLSIRSLDAWWGSVAAYGIGRGAPPLSRKARHEIALSERSWQDVVTEVARAFPGAELRVQPFEGRPEPLFLAATGQIGPTDAAPEWRNAAPDLTSLRAILRKRGLAHLLPLGAGRWEPFTDEERSALRERYEDDLFWLRAGAGGLATIRENQPQGAPLRRTG